MQLPFTCYAQQSSWAGNGVPNAIHTAVPLLLAGLFLVGGCATVDSRVVKNQALFESLDAETQATLLSGRTKLGYTTAMTYIALGAPDEIRRKQSEDGDSTTWVYRYSSPGLYSSAFHVQSAFHHGGHFHSHYDPFFYTYPPYDYIARDYLHVVFVGGRVVSIEHFE